MLPLSDALYGLREIFASYPFLLSRSLGTVIPDAARLISDDDTGVRKALHAFLSSYLPHFSRNRLRPYTSTLLLFTSTALSHIFPDVRLDAVRVLDLLCDALGDDVTSGWQAACQALDGRSSSSQVSGLNGATTSVSNASFQHGSRILQCYMTLLGVSLSGAVGANQGAKPGPASASIISTDLTSASRLVILQSLLKFLQRGNPKATVSDSPDQCPTWCFEAAFSSRSDFDAFKVSLRPDKRRTMESATDNDSLELASESLVDLDATLGRGWSVEELATSVAGAAAFLQTLERSEKGRSANGNSPFMHLFTALAPVLITNFLDSAPTAFPPSSSLSAQQQQQQLSTHAQIVCVVAGLALVLWRGVAREARDASGNISTSFSDRETLSRLVGHMTPYFPFAGLSSFCDGSSWSVEAREQLLNLSLTYCELVALLSMAETKQQAQQPTKGQKKLQGQLHEVSQFIPSIITGQPQNDSSTMGGGEAASTIAARSLSSEAYANLLPTVWLLLSRSAETAVVGPLLDALLRHWTLLKATDPAREISTEFIGRLILLTSCPSYTSSFRIPSTLTPRLVDWLGKDLPRHLWELGGRNVTSSEKTLELLRCVVSMSLFPAVGDTLQSTLVPFFHFVHPTRGAIIGPYARLPQSGQAQAKGLLAYLAPLTPALQDAVTRAGL